jgi:hypothetical protein
MKLVWAAVAAALLLTACGEDSSASHAREPDLSRDVCALVPDDVLPGAARSSSSSEYGGTVCSINEPGEMDQIGSVTFTLAVDDEHAATAMRKFCQIQSGVGREAPLSSDFPEGCAYARDGWGAVVTRKGRALMMSSIRGHFSRDSALDQATRAVEALLPLSAEG